MSSAEPGRRGGWAAAGAAFAAALVVYLAVARVQSFGFVNYDDVFVLAPENPAIAKGPIGGLRDLVTDVTSARPFMNAWLPLYYWSLGLDRAIGGGAAWVYHAHNAVLHALAAGLVALIARRVGASAFTAGLAGVVFAVHPAATESVAWVASRKCPLSFVWMGVAILAYLRGIERGSVAAHVAGAAATALAMLANGTAVVLPLLLAVHAVLVRDDATKLSHRLRAIVPYAAVAGVLTAIHLAIAVGEGTAVAPTLSVLTSDLEVTARYAGLFAVPVRQSVEHGVDPAAVDGTRAFFGVLLLLGAAVTVALTRRRAPLVAAVVLAVTAALLPFNNVLPRTSVLFAERYAYVALLPVSIGIAWILRRRGEGPGSMLPAAVGVGVLAALTAMRLPVWTDSVTLWTDAAEKAPRSALVQCQLGEALESSARASTGDDAKALAARAEAAWRSARMLASSPLDRLRAEAGLGGFLLLDAGAAQDPAARLKEAIAAFGAADAAGEGLSSRGVEGRRAEVLTKLGTACELLGDGAAARTAYERAVKLDLRSALAWNGLARIHLAAGKADEAAEALARSSAAEPSDPRIVRDRVNVRLASGDAAAARKDLADAIAARPRDTELLVYAAGLDRSWLRPVDAETKLRQALDAKPDDPEIREMLAAALLDQAESHASRDDMSGAREAARKAGLAAPGSFAPEQMLGIVSRRAGELEEAAEHLRRARALHPDGLRIKEQLASVLAELAVRMLDDRREAIALLLLEEAVLTNSSAVSTPAGRLDTGVADWPPAAAGDDRAVVARRAALRGLAYLAMGRTDDAAKDLAVADAGTRGGDPALRRVTLRLLARAAVRSGRADDAVRCAEENVALDVPGDADWRWRREAERADALIERGTARRGTADAAGGAADFATARAALDLAKTAGMPESRYRTRLGEIRFREEDFLGATKEFDLAEAASARDVEPVLDRAQVWRTLYLQEEDKAFLAQAERDFRRAMEIAPGDARVLAGLGETLVMLQRPSDAFPPLQKAVLSDPSQVGARRLLADLMVRAGRSHLEKLAGAPPARVQQELVEARSAAERAVALDPPTPDALLFLGEVLRAQGDWAEPLAKFEAARDRFPGTTAPLDAIAKFYADRGHFQLLFKKRAEAISDFKRALDVKGATVDLADAKARLHEIAVTAFGEAMELERAGKSADAAERFALSVYAEPTPEASFSRGVLLGRIGKDEESIAAYDAVLAIDPKMLGARLNRAGALLKVGRFDQSIEEYGRWLDAAPKDDPNRRAAERQVAWIREQQREMEAEKKR